MNRQEIVKWLESLKAEIGKSEHGDLWHYAKSIDMAIEALYKPTSDDLIIKGAKGIKDGLYNIQNGELFKYKAKGGTVRAYPIVEALQDDWIPVSERLPAKYEVEEDNRFFVTQSNGSVGIYVFNYDGTSEEYWKRNVVAWRPLPEPYAESEDD